MPDEVVGYTVKEILIRIDSKLDAMDAKLETKADRTRVHQLASDVAGLSTVVKVLEETTVKKDGPEMGRLRDLEDARAESTGERGYKRFIWPAAAAIVGSSWWLPALLGHKV